MEKFRSRGWLRLRLKLEPNEGLKLENTEFVVWRLLLKSASNDPPVGRLCVAPKL